MPFSEAALKAGLLADTDLAAIIGVRLWRLSLPEHAVLPAVVYTVIANPPEQAITRRVVSRSPRVQFDCWAESAVDVIELANTLEAALLALHMTDQHGLSLLNNRDMETGVPGLERRLVEAVMLSA